MADTYLNLILRASKTGSAPADARRELQALAREQQASQRAGVQATKAYFEMGQALRTSSSLATVTGEALGRLRDHMQAGRLTTEQYANAARAAMLQSQQLSPASLKAADSINILNARYASGQINAQQFAQGLRAVQGELQASQGFMERYGAQVKALAVVSLAALAVGFVDVARNAGQFEASMNQIIALTNTTRGELGNMTTEVLNMAREVGRSPDELARGLYFVASSGFAGEKGLKVLEAAAKASAAGLGETKVVADAVTSTLNAYGLGVEQATRVTDVLIKVVKEGKGEPSSFAGALGRILPIASAAGVTFEQVGASMATMTRVGLSAEEAATALRGALGALYAPGKQATDALASIGISTDQLRTSIRDRGLLVTLQDLMERTHGNVETLDLIIPNIRALTGVLATSGKQAGEYARILREMERDTGDTATAFGIASETMQFKANQVAASFDVLKVTIGNALLPTLKSLLEAINGVIGGFLALDTHTQNAYASFAAVALAAAPAAVAIDKVKSGIIGLGKEVKTFRDLREGGASLFKALSALRAIEFGAIIAGLTVIVTWLGRVSEMAQKSTEDVIKLAQSGDLLDRSAAAFELLTNGQQRLKVALDGTHTKIVEGEKEYADYRSAIDATARAAGFEINAAGDLVRVYTGMSGRQEQVIQKNYVLTQSTFEAAKGMGGVSAAMDEGRRFAHGYSVSAEDAAKANQALGISAEEAAAQQRNLALQVAVMTAGYGGAASKEMTEYNQKQDEAKAKAADLLRQIKELEAAQGTAITTGKKAALTADEITAKQTKLAAITEDLTLKARKKNETDKEFAARMAGLQVQADNLTTALGGTGSAYVDNSKKIAELKIKYDEATAAIDANVKAHDEAMKRIVLDIAQQQLAVDGWTQAEINGFTLVAQKMGIFSEADAQLTRNVLGATAALAADGNAEIFAGRIGVALDAVVAKTQGAATDMAGVPPAIADAWIASTEKIKGGATSAADTINATLPAATKNAVVVPAGLEMYYDELDGATKKAQETGEKITKAIPKTIAAPTIDMTNFTGSAAKLESFPLVLARVAQDENTGLFAQLFNVSMTSVQQDATNTATAINTTIPPALMVLATSPAPDAFARLFSGSMDKVIGDAKRGSDGIYVLKSAINQLTDKTITITTFFKTVGEPSAESAPAATTGRQGGGWVGARSPVLVGESGPELFFPARGGYVMNNGDSQRLIGALEALARGGQGAPAAVGGDTIIINDQMALAQFYEQRRRALIDRHNARMGG